MARLSADDVVDNEDVVAVRVVVVVVGHANARLGQDPTRVAVRVVRKVGVGVLVKVDQVNGRLLAWLKVGMFGQRTITGEPTGIAQSRAGRTLGKTYPLGARGGGGPVLLARPPPVRLVVYKSVPSANFILCF